MFRCLAICLSLALFTPTVSAQAYVSPGAVANHTWSLQMTEGTPGNQEAVFVLRDPSGKVLGAWFPDYQRWSAYTDGVWRALVETAPIQPPAAAIYPARKVRKGEYISTPKPTGNPEPIFDHAPNFGVVKSEISSEPRTTVHYAGKVATLSADDVPQDGNFNQMIFIAENLEKAKAMKAKFLATPDAAPFKDKMHFHAMGKDDERLKCGYDLTAPEVIYCQDYTGKVLFRAPGQTAPATLFGAVRRLPNPNYDPKKDPIVGSENPLGPVWDFLKLNPGVAVIFGSGLIFVYLRNRKPVHTAVPLFTLKV